MSDERKGFSLKGIINSGKNITKNIGDSLPGAVSDAISEGIKIAGNAASAVKDPEFKEKISQGIESAVSQGKAAVGKTAEATKKFADSVQSKTEEVMTSDQMVTLLDDLYGKAMDGIPHVSKSVEDLAYDYLSKNSDPGQAAKSLINNQLLKCTTSGFLSGLGGITTLAVTLPANVTSVLYVQLRMIAAIAKLGGFDPNDDQVQSLVYACMTGQAVGDILKGAGIKLGQKFATAGINKITGAALTKINQAVGFRLITKFGETGIINLGKMVPVVGGVIGGGFDLMTTRVIAANAYKLFIEKSTDFETSDSEPDIADAEIVRTAAENAEADIKDIFNVYSEGKDYLEQTIKVCDEMDIPYRLTKVQAFNFISVKCDPVKLAQLAVRLNEYGAFTISAVTSDEVATINSWK